MQDEAPPATIYVSAFFCQSVIRDKRDILTAVRITNGYIAAPTTVNFPFGGVMLTQTLYLPLTFQAVVTFTSTGPAEFNFSIRGFDPEGIELTPAPPATRCKVLGGSEGHAFNIAMNVPTQKEGLVSGKVLFRSQ